MKPIPITADDLITELDAEYPARPPRITDSERQVWIDVGKRELVEALLRRREKTNRTERQMKGTS